MPSAVSVIGILALLTMFIQDASANIAAMHNQLDNTTQLISKKQSQKKELAESIAQLEKKLAQAEASRDTFTKALDTLDQQGNVMNGDLEVTTNSLSGAVSLTGISHAGDKLTIRGRSPNEMEALSYARSLNASDRFSEVTITSIARVEEGGGMDFTLALKAKGQG